MPFITPDNTDNRRLLGVYIYYRLSLGLLLGILHWTGLSQEVFGSARPTLFTNVAVLYIAACVLSLLLYWANLLTTKTVHLLAILIIDFVGLVVLIYASDNLNDGLGYLLLIPMAVASTFLHNRLSIGLAAFATLLVLGMSLLNISSGWGDSSSFFAAGITGVSLFITAIAFNLSAEKIQSSEQTARQQTQQANYLQIISQRIVETMRTGIIVVDNHLRIQLINNAAAQLLTVNNRFEGIDKIDAIYQRLSQWQNDGVIPAGFDFNLENNQIVKVSFATLEEAQFPSIMLFIEDMQRLNQEAQQLKLASLGRLTASIAHEIRNPLGAISHAEQLLSESNSIVANDKKLLSIIHNHSQRINFIITNILEFSRRKRADPQVIHVNQWLRDFKHEFLQHRTGNIDIIDEQRDVHAKVDTNHLYQIINNLLDNGMRYSNAHIQEEKMTLKVNVRTMDQRPYIDIIDYGKGIPSDKRHHIFEPFYTTEDTGSGLGLYLCKELSEANQANLSYSYDIHKTVSIFRLVLAHPKRKIELE